MSAILDRRGVKEKRAQSPACEAQGTLFFEVARIIRRHLIGLLRPPLGPPLAKTLLAALLAAGALIRGRGYGGGPAAELTLTLQSDHSAGAHQQVPFRSLESQPSARANHFTGLDPRN
jgi:hypothetical protein